MAVISVAALASPPEPSSTPLWFDVTVGPALMVFLFAVLPAMGRLALRRFLWRRRARTGVAHGVAPSPSPTHGHVPEMRHSSETPTASATFSGSTRPLLPPESAPSSVPRHSSPPVEREKVAFLDQAVAIPLCRPTARSTRERSQEPVLSSTRLREQRGRCSSHRVRSSSIRPFSTSRRRLQQRWGSRQPPGCARLYRATRVWDPARGLQAWRRAGWLVACDPCCEHCRCAEP